MAAPIPFTLTNESITVVMDGVSHTIQKGAPQFNVMAAALNDKRWDDVRKNLTVSGAVSGWSKGKFTIKDNVAYFGKDKVHESLGRRIVAMTTKGEDPTPLFNFWERLQKNPSMRSTEQLWGFLQNQGIPISKTGMILAYKSITQDFKDVHTKTIDNKPGVVNEMPRNKISDDPRVACHYGYHVGALSYAQTFHQGGRIVVCEIDPADVVCVPYDEQERKMRVCKYRVMGHHNGQLLPDTTFEEDVHTKTAKKVMEEPAELPAVGVEATLEDLKGSDHLAETQDKVVVKGKVVKDRDNPVTPKRKQQEEIHKETGCDLSPEDMKELDEMDMDGLVLESLDTLRKYATYHVKLIGASKVPGGKVALIMKLLEVRITNG